MPALVSELIDQVKSGAVAGTGYADVKMTECYAGVCRSLEQYLGGAMAKWTCPKLSSVLCAASALTSSFAGYQEDPMVSLAKLPLVSPAALASLVDIKHLLNGSQHLQDIAFAYPEHNRVFGSKGHNDTVKWIYDTLNATGYYDVELQYFTSLYSGGNASLTLNGVEVTADLFTYAPRGTVNAPVVGVTGGGCNVSDFASNVKDNVALIERGTCPFGTKAANAKKAGAKAAIIYDNVPAAEPASGTLGGPGDYVPVVGVTMAVGHAIIASLLDGNAVFADVHCNSIMENRTSTNVIAETKLGDHDNVIALGAHTDSVEAGPGINDDGSGTVAQLVIAQYLTQFSVNNAVRFCFWSGEEEGLLGSKYYVQQLNKSQTEVDKIRAYLDFDMIASPNYILAVYDGSGRGFNMVGPPGSTEMQDHFELFFELNGYSHVPTAFDGRSDYGPFLKVGIASGGIFSGAEEIKTKEWAKLFGGTVGVACDECYHLACDTMKNLNHEAYLIGAQAIADSVAAYAVSMKELGPKKKSVERQEWVKEMEESGVFRTNSPKERGSRNQKKELLLM